MDFVPVLIFVIVKFQTEAVKLYKVRSRMMQDTTEVPLVDSEDEEEREDLFNDESDSSSESSNDETEGDIVDLKCHRILSVNLLLTRNILFFTHILLIF